MAKSHLLVKEEVEQLFFLCNLPKAVSLCTTTASWNLPLIHQQYDQFTDDLRAFFRKVFTLKILLSGKVLFLLILAIFNDVRMFSFHT